MAQDSDKEKGIQPLDSGRLLTPEEATFLQDYLLGTEAPVVVGDENKKRIARPPKKAPKRPA